MRLVPLNVFEQKGDFVESVRSASLAVLSPMMQGDTVQLAVTKLVLPDDPSATLDAFVIKPWDFTSIRASIGYVDRAPEAGSFRIKVGDTTSDPLTWPTDLSAQDLIDTWHAAVLAAVNTAAGDGTPARLDNPAGTPANFIYITWVSETDDRVIEVVDIALVPLIDSEYAVTNLQPLPAFQQLIKLIRLPLVMATDFAFPFPPAATVATDRAGGAGVNAVQLITVPAGAAGAFDLGWSGTRTTPLNVDGITASEISDALNAIVTDGATNPSFSVTSRTVISGFKFAVEFIGPLAAAAQTDLTVTMTDQVPLTTALGTLVLRRAAFERVLNGAPSVTLSFELVITAEGGESTVLRTITLINDMTDPGTPTSVDDQGGIIVMQEPVYIDNSTLEMFASVAPGATFAPPSAVDVGAAMVVDHELGTLKPRVYVLYESSLVPAQWRELSVNGEYEWHSTDANHISLSFPIAITDTPGDANYRLRYQIYISSPDARVDIFGTLKTTWDDVLDTLPAGLSVRAKFALIDAALGVIGGSITVPASSIGGTISPLQIDIPALVKAILLLIGSNPDAMAQFLALMSNSQVDQALLTAFTNSQNIASFISALTTAVNNAGASSLIDAIANALTNNATFNTNIRNLVVAAFQEGGTLPAGFELFAFADWEFIGPSIHNISGPSSPVVTGSVDTTTVDGGTTTKTTVPTLTLVPTTKIQQFELLPSEVVGFTTGATVSGAVTLSDFTDGQIRITTGTVMDRTIGARRGISYTIVGTHLACKNGIIFPVRIAGGNAWPSEMERCFFNAQLDAGSLYEDSRFALNFTLQTQLLGGPTGRIDFVVEAGTSSHEAGETLDINAFTWTPVFTKEIRLSEALRMMSVAIAVTNTAGTLAGTVGLHGNTPVAFSGSMPTLPFGVRCWLRNFDVENVTAAKGAFIARVKSPAGSIAALTS